MTDRITGFLDELNRELLKRGMKSSRILPELGLHLQESVESYLRRGFSSTEAQELALQNFGSPNIIARQFEKESAFMKQKILFAAAVVVGILIAFVDSRPTWDDTGITVFAILVSGGIIGLLVRKAPWLYALALGIWIPLFAILFKHDFMMLITLLFPFIGVYAGWALHLLGRKVLHTQ